MLTPFNVAAISVMRGRRLWVPIEWVVGMGMKVGTSIWNVNLGRGAWDVELGSLQMGTSFEFRLGTSARRFWLGIFSLGTLVQQLWLGSISVAVMSW